LGHGAKSLTIENKILLGLFLCTKSSNDILNAFKPDWSEKITLSIEEKLSIINYPFLVEEVFPWKNELSEGIDHQKFCESFLIQPDLFIRIRPGKEKTVIRKLRQAQIDVKRISETCIALPNTSKIDKIIKVDDEAVVQDYSSQKTGEFLSSEILDHQSKISLWDCCAASGGKSIMAYDINPAIELTVSDIREGILINLRKRFQKAGIKSYNSIITDLSKSNFQFSTFNFQLIIADVPCTGSGTWSRSPEQLYYFDEKKIEEYSVLQTKIVSNAIPHLEIHGSFIYITCSVFKKENEEVVSFIKENFGLQLKRTEVLKGYDKKADSMFVAVFEKL
jgi:16S rRNA (cytosine967-C5)-methyltransferase